MNGTEYRSNKFEKKKALSNRRAAKKEKKRKPFEVGEQVYYAVEDRCTIFSGFGKIETVEEYWCLVVSLDGTDYTINKSDLYRTKEELIEAFNYWLKDIDISKEQNAEVSNA